MSNQIFENLIKPIENCEIFFVYNSFGKEIDTHKFITYLIHKGKIVYLPKIVSKNMVAVKIDKYTQFTTSNYGM